MRVQHLKNASCLLYSGRLCITLFSNEEKEGENEDENEDNEKPKARTIETDAGTITLYSFTLTVFDVDALRTMVELIGELT